MKFRNKFLISAATLVLVAGIASGCSSKTKSNTQSATSSRVRHKKSVKKHKRAKKLETTASASSTSEVDSNSSQTSTSASHVRNTYTTNSAQNNQASASQNQNMNSSAIRQAGQDWSKRGGYKSASPDSFLYYFGKDGNNTIIQIAEKSSGHVVANYYLTPSGALYYDNISTNNRVRVN
ncbi:hypothetical protein [Lactobacillus psittaci]|uniref:hypothetical protein n=1 Tax=Lactobacillus psittaci TaxID=116089 RepID=UPI00041A5060|nr:hypothetical protein [Lactobacillus psittaci]